MTERYRIGSRVLLGTAYYPEYLDTDRVDEDLRLMAEAGIALIRVGESVWSTWEPQDGRFELDWLAPVLDAAHGRGIHAVLGTPTYAVPLWLMAAHPEIAGESATGVRVPWGARQEADITHPTFRRYAERVIRAVVGRYADHPAVVGFQVDNEPGQHLLHNDHVFADFTRWLLDRYGTVEHLNRHWNLAHWAHRLATVDELWRPDGNHVPQYDLAWRRFQAERTTEYIAWQVRLVREYAHDDQFVTTCVDTARPAVHEREIGEVVDVAATNLYVASQSELSAETVGDPAFPPSGSWAPFFGADRARAARRERFMVTETNAGSIGAPWFNYPGYDGQWRQVAWAMVARGARLVAYWHWHSMHASWESYWSGVLPHSLEPGRVYRNVARLGREIAGAGAAIEGIVPDAQVGLVLSVPSRWAFEFHPPLPDPAADPRKQAGPDRLAYERILYRFYGGLNRAGLGVDVWHAEQLVREDPARVAARLPAVVAPGVAVAGDELARWLLAYAAAGGHAVVGVRTATADDQGRVRGTRQPAGLADAAGVTYDELSNLVAPVRVTGALTGAAELLLEGLEPAGARVLAGYDHPHFGRWAAATTNAHGAGRLTYLGAVPDLELATGLARWVAGEAGLTHPWAPALVPGRVQVHGATNGAGDRLWFVHNFSDEPAGAVAPADLEDVLEPRASLRAGDTVDLGPWDVRVLRERR